MTATNSHLRVETEDGVGWLTFDRPERHNALTIEMSDAIVAALEQIAADDSVRVVALRGAGGVAFMSGADIKEQGALPEEFRLAAHRMLEFVGAFAKPVVAVIEGYCFGGGLSIALQADLRIAADTSTFAIPAARLGIGYPWHSVGPLVALVGPGVAADLLLTGRRINAFDAQRIGIVQHLYPAGEIESSARDFLAQIAANAPLSLSAAKTAIRLATPIPPADKIAELVAILNACERSDDYQEGQAAFRERRAPRFQGC